MPMKLRDTTNLLVLVTVAVALCLPAPDVSAYGGEVPSMSVSISPGTLDYGTVGYGSEPVRTLRIRNDGDCTVNASVRIYGEGFTGLCPRLEHSQSIRPGDSQECEIVFHHDQEGNHRGEIVTEYSRTRQCVQNALREADRYYADKIRKAEKEIRTWQHDNPLLADFEPRADRKVDRSLKNLDRLEERLEDIKEDTSAIEQREKRLQRQSQNARERHNSLTKRLEEWQNATPDVRPLDERWQRQKERLEERIEDFKDRVSESCAEPARLQEEMRQHLKELAEGKYCSECGRSATQIKNQTGEEFQEHLGRVRGHPEPASQEELEEAEQDYRRQITRAHQQCRRDEEQLENTGQQLRQRRTQWKTQRQNQIDNYNKRLRQYREQRDQHWNNWLAKRKVLEEAIEAAEEAHEKRVEQAEEAFEDARWEHRQMLNRLDDEENRIRFQTRQKIRELRDKIRRLNQDKQADRRRINAVADDSEEHTTTCRATVPPPPEQSNR